MKKIPPKRMATPSNEPSPCDSMFDEPEEPQKEIDPDAVAKKITDPLIESVRRELEKIDVTQFKK
jgi:hypothetical protein